MRRTLFLATALALGLALGATVASSKSSVIRDQNPKLTPAMAAIVAQGGYGAYPIADLVPDYVPGNVYYLARIDGKLDDSLQQALADAGATIRYYFRETGVVSLVSPLSAVDAVAQLSQVKRIDLDRPLQVLSAKVHLGTSYGDQTERGNHDVGADTLWARGTTGQDVTVGVVDSGVGSTHPDLQNLKGFVDCIDVVPTFVGDDAGACEAQPGFDDNGHGTHVSGIVAGQAVGGPLGEAGLYPGMAPDASLVGAKVCNAAGSCLTSAIMAGVRVLAAEPPDGLGADVINLSLGGGRFYLAGLSNAEEVTNDDDLDREMNALAQQDNVLFSVAAGNSGPVLQSVGNPADASQVLAVGASIADWDLNHDKADTAHGELGNIRPEAAQAGATGIAQFSSRGPSGDRLIKPDVTARASM